MRGSHGLVDGLPSWSLLVPNPSPATRNLKTHTPTPHPTHSILLYNVGGGPEGADDTLYGVEPWSFYLKNLLLNFNVALPLALLLPPVLAALPWPHWSLRAKREVLLFTSPAFLWLAVMASRPHKEERFLFPIYPLLCLAAALTVHGVVISLVEVAASVGALLSFAGWLAFRFRSRRAGRAIDPRHS